jgi:hypothetical protein
VVAKTLFISLTERALSERCRDAGILTHFDVDKALASSLRRKIGYI